MSFFQQRLLIYRGIQYAYFGGTTDYRTIENFEPCKIFLSGFDKNLSQASKIFFGCRNDEIILIPTYDSASAYQMPYGMSSDIRVCGGCGVLGLNGPVVDCLLCQWGGFVPYWGPRGLLIQYLICIKIKAPKVEKYSYSEYYYLYSVIIIFSKL
jgi:hypothetical protein